MSETRPLVSLVVPCYNEAQVLEKNMASLCDYMKTLEDRYRWELLIVDDGSRDGSADVAERFAAGRPGVRVLRHRTNFRLGQVLRFAFNNCRGEYVVTLDADLSYAPEHVERLLQAMIDNRAKIVLASPYMPGGSVANVPRLRLLISRVANRFLSFMAKGSLSTLTGMVRAYDRRFLRSLSLRAMDMSVNAEIIYKAMLLRALIVEIPGHLAWAPAKPGVRRRSGMRIVSNTMTYVLSGFMFRPFVFFTLPGLALLLFSLYPGGWAGVHILEHLAVYASAAAPLDVRLSAAVSGAFRQAPHTFILAGVGALLGIQFLSLGVLALQGKKQFEELYHLCSNVYRHQRDRDDAGDTQDSRSGGAGT